MTDLAGAGVRILLIGTAGHEGPTLTPVPAAARSVMALRQRLLDRCGVRPDRLRLLVDPPDAATMAAAIAEAARAADSVLLVYYVGHGLLGPGGELYLAATGTDRLVPGLAAHQALSVAAIREAVTSCPAAAVVVVLDCCFAGRALAGSGVRRSPELAFTLPATHGIYWLGSAHGYASAPADEEYTAFTGSLIDLLDRGDPRAPRQLTLDAVYDHLFRTMRARSHPLPQRQAGDRSGELVFAPNLVQPAPPEPDDPALREPEPGRCPYPGLAAFGIEDADLFRGRERVVDRLVAVASGALAARQPVVVVGPSGAGKTSLLHAGLLARLQWGAPELPGCGGSPWIVLTPQEHPLEALAARLAPAEADAADRIRRDPAVAAALVEALPRPRPEARLVLVVDQLERLFTLGPDEVEQVAFLTALAAIADAPGNAGSALVVLALRADLYGRAAAHPVLAQALSDHQFILGPMEFADLRAAIEQPAAATGWVLDDGLADLVLHELGASSFRQPHAGMLPLLAHTLWATWQRRQGTRLTVAGYRATGGVAQALAVTADQTYTALDDAGREATRWMLPRLVHIDDEAMDTARPVDRGALLHGVPGGLAADLALARFAEARLVTLDRDTVRISHEALLHGWPLLWGWIDADRDWLRTRQQLTADAEGWRRSGRDPSLLYRGTRLGAVRERAAATPQAVELPPALAEFLAASRRYEERAARARRAVVAGLVVLLLLAVTGGVGALAFQRRAADQRDIALTRLLVSEAESQRESQPGLSKQLALIAYGVDSSIGAGAVYAAQETPGVFNAEQPAHDLALGGDGSVLALSTGRQLLLRGLTDGRRSEVTDLNDKQVGAIALAADGGLLAASLYDEPAKGEVVAIWRLTDPATVTRVAVQPVPESTVNALAVSRDGRLLAAALGSGRIALWRLASAGAPTRLPDLVAHPRWADSLAFSPDSRTLASAGDDGKLKMWSVADPARLTLLSQVPAAPVRRNPADTSDQDFDKRVWTRRVAFDAAGRYLVAPSGDDPAKSAVWDVRPPDRPRRLAIAGGLSSEEIVGLTFGAGDQVVAVGSRNGTRLYRFVAPNSGRPAQYVAAGRVKASVGAAPALRRSPAGWQLLQATGNGVQVWDAANPWRPGTRMSLAETPGGFRTSTAFSRSDPSLIALAGAPGTQVWRIGEDSPVTLLGQIPGVGPAQGGGLALRPDGTLMATVEPVGKLVAVQLRRTESLLADPVATITDLDNGAIEMRFSPDGRLLAVVDNAEFSSSITRPPSVKLFDITDPVRPQRIASLPGQVWDTSFSPNGRLLAGFGNNALLTWDLSDPRRPMVGPVRQLTARSILANGAFSPDGRLLMAGDTTGTLWTWRVDADRLVDPPSVVRTGGAPHGLEFSPNGLTIAFETEVAGVSRVELWNVADPGRPVLRGAFAFEETSLGDVELVFTPDGRQLTVNSGDGRVDFWDVDPARAVGRICASVGDPISPEQWARYVPSLPYRPPCD
ncbi:caspase family protein [Micromonospora sp. WMMD1120]|uniref:caspase, EACC1-associated type n=1 Tax=Micromonospora sp. WMMD1120 TaxID=3016106 RepID=UPI0024163DF6|nr:AAA family ATPase [Micromonospora sp. WMMD1120]MDG4810998.1 caspase family protein [Micromonospora sp. WMMD1120]